MLDWWICKISILTFYSQHFQAWQTPRCYIKWSTATACHAPLAVPPVCMILCSSVGSKTRWRGRRSKPCSGNWRTSSPWRGAITRRPVVTETGEQWRVNNLKKCCYYYSIWMVWLGDLKHWVDQLVGTINNMIENSSVALLCGDWRPRGSRASDQSSLDDPLMTPQEVVKIRKISAQLTLLFQ